MRLDSQKNKLPFSAKLFQYQGKKLEQLSIADETAYQKISDNLNAAKLPPRVVRVDKKGKQRNAAAPFTTSTLQQEGVRKLGMSADRVMRIAQQLYEGIDIGGQTVGLISYMRTDSVNLAQEAIAEIRGYISSNFSSDYLPRTVPVYKSKAKNAQEAHEAIRPTSIARSPDSIRDALTVDQARLYELIWKRTLASQMTPARFDTVSVDIRLGGDDTLFRASGQTLVFPGFIAVYQEDTDDSTEEEGGKLPPLEEGDILPVDKLYGEQHFTQPPPRFTEASLVKTLEVGLAGAVGQHDGAAHDLVGLLRVDAELHGHVDRFIELRGGAFLHERQCGIDRVQLGRLDLAGGRFLAFGQRCHVR